MGWSQALVGVAALACAGGARAADGARGVGSLTVETPSFDPERRWALIIGVNTYDEFEDLRFASRDAEALAEALIEGGFPKDHVVVMRSDACGELALEDCPEAQRRLLPTDHNIQRELGRIGELEEADTLLVAFSGHGLAPPGDASETYLLPTDAQPKRLEQTAVSLRDVRRTLEGTGAPRRLVLVDACRSDLPGARATQSPLDAAEEGEVVIYSTRAGALSYEDDDLGMGVFTHHLVQGLAGQADGDPTDEWVTVEELWAHVQRQMKVEQRSGRAQVPMVQKNVTGDFPLVHVPGASPPLPLIEPPVAVTASQESPFGPRIWAGAGSTRLGAITEPQGQTVPVTLFGPELGVGLGWRSWSGLGAYVDLAVFGGLGPTSAELAPLPMVGLVQGQLGASWTMSRLTVGVGPQLTWGGGRATGVPASAEVELPVLLDRVLGAGLGAELRWSPSGSELGLLVRGQAHRAANQALSFGGRVGLVWTPEKGGS
ncbi:MAG: caspase family protein [Alphaproteobacteria bacterium]|nr:caspase family protein [Alphaproteobacteria bacterium]